MATKKVEQHEEPKHEEPVVEAKLPEMPKAVGPMPTVGRMVHYHLTAEQAAEVSRVHAVRQGRLGNEHVAGQLLPMIVVQVWGAECVNGQVFLDGVGSLWVKSTNLGAGAGQWSWPEIKK